MISAPSSRTGLFSARSIHRAYLECRRRKRGTPGAIQFEMNLAGELVDLERELATRTYRPRPGLRFVTQRPKLREIVAAPFRDRVVHHLLVSAIEPDWERAFIYDSYSCRRGRGTHAAVDRLQSFVRDTLRQGRGRAYFLQADVRSFFMSIDRAILFERLDRRLRQRFGLRPGPDPMRVGREAPRQAELPLPACRGSSPSASDIERYHELRWLCRVLVFHDPLDGSRVSGDASLLARIPPHKTLAGCRPGTGLPIGNLTSQFFANVYLDGLDQLVKHQLKARRYLRYCDDIVLLYSDPDTLRQWLSDIAEFLERALRLELNPARTRLKPASCGIDFLGYVVHPHHRLVRRRVVGNLRSRLRRFAARFVERLEPDPAGGRPRVLLLRHPAGEVERLRDVLCSYWAHFAHADARRLVRSLWRRNPWLGELLELHAASVRPRLIAGGPFPGLRAQYGRFAGLAEPGLLLFQIGRYIELLDGQADRFGPALGLRAIEPRPGFRSRCGFHRALMKRYLGLSLRELCRSGSGRPGVRRLPPGSLSRLPRVPVTVVVQTELRDGRVAGRRVAARLLPAECLEPRDLPESGAKEQ